MEISIIVPVYNVGGYLEQCMVSLANQTFRNFEVIIVDDGSTDDSGSQCIEWARKDSRFHYYRQENQGVSSARNFGIEQAAGKYLAFVDPDDWVDCRFLELMYKAAEKDNADMAECEVYRYNSNTGKKTYRHTYGCMGREYTKTERIKYGYTQIWKTLTKRNLWVNNNIVFPNCFAQIRGVYALLVALSNKVVVVREPLYVYRKFRKDSISARGYITAHIKECDENNIDNVEGIAAYRNLLDGFKRCGIYNQYAEILEEMIKFKSSDLLTGLFLQRSTEEFQKKEKAYQYFINDMFPNMKHVTYAVLGGYNLNRITWHMNALHNPFLRFNFSSIISLMHPVEEKIMFETKNVYRSIMIERDIHSLFWEIIDKSKPQVLVIDFIDERFDVIKIKDGYLTKSDALDEAYIQDENKELVRWGSEEYIALWEDSCQKFIDRINKHYPHFSVILVENYLSESKGDMFKRNYYSNMEEIRKINHGLKMFYDFFISHCKNVKIVEPRALELYFTDEGYEYGAIPSHLNDIVNRQIAKKIEDELGIESSSI